MSQEKFEMACVVADFACWLDGVKHDFEPDLMLEAEQCVESLHDLAEKLAGDRVDEIYLLDEECEVAAMKGATIVDKTNQLWPFAGPKYGSQQLYQMAVDDRLAAVKLMGRAALEAALLVTGLQKTVESAIRSRLRKLEVQA